jgi:chromate transporter
LRGVAPVVVAIVAHALWKFVATALKSWPARAVALLSIMLLILNVAELAVLGVAAALGLLMGWYMKRDAERTRGSTVDAPAPEPPDNNTSTRSDQTPRVPLLVFFAPALGGSAPVWALFWSFLKIGSILYGSGYVLIAFLQAEFVPQLLTQQQLLDAVAVGQVTPGPVFTTATFIGFQIAGWPGAVAATIGIFLPSFFFVALLSVLMEKLHRSLIMRGFLDAVNAASLALMAWATWLLSRSSLTDAVPILVMVVSLALLLKTRLNPTWLIAAGAVIGWFTSASA